eukprot:scaffold547_cov384-Prasinococcus_capsulatus_cf.AAC.21
MRIVALSPSHPSRAGATCLCNGLSQVWLLEGAGCRRESRYQWPACQPCRLPPAVLASAPYVTAQVKQAGGDAHTTGPLPPRPLLGVKRHRVLSAAALDYRRPRAQRPHHAGEGEKLHSFR